MRKRNQGSAVIEMTLLIPIFLGCIYFYIILFLFFIQSGQQTEQIAEKMYVIQETDATENADENISVRTEGNTKIFWIEETGKWFDIRSELRKNESDAVKNVRRWQLVADLF